MKTESERSSITTCDGRETERGQLNNNLQIMREGNTKIGHTKREEGKDLET